MTERREYLEGLYRVYSTPGVGDFHDDEEGITWHMEWERDEQAEQLVGLAKRVLSWSEEMDGEEGVAALLDTPTYNMGVLARRNIDRLLGIIMEYLEDPASFKEKEAADGNM